MKALIYIFTAAILSSCSLYKSDARKILEDGAFTFRNGSLTLSEAAAKHCYPESSPLPVLKEYLPSIQKQLDHDIYETYNVFDTSEGTHLEFVSLNYNLNKVSYCTYVTSSADGFSLEDQKEILAISRYYTQNN